MRERAGNVIRHEVELKHTVKPNVKVDGKRLTKVWRSMQGTLRRGNLKVRGQDKGKGRGEG